jgi:hypothetical protein
MEWVKKSPDAIEQVTTRGFNVYVYNHTELEIDAGEVSARFSCKFKNPIDYAKLLLGKYDLKLEQHQVERFNNLPNDSIKLDCMVNPFNWNIKVEILNAN